MTVVRVFILAILGISALLAAFTLTMCHLYS